VSFERALQRPWRKEQNGFRGVGGSEGDSTDACPICRLLRGPTRTPRGLVAQGLEGRGRETIGSHAACAGQIRGYSSSSMTVRLPRRQSEADGALVVPACISSVLP
jgi:hypothetical protein